MGGAGCLQLLVRRGVHIFKNLWSLHWKCNPPNTPNTRKESAYSAWSAVKNPVCSASNGSFLLATLRGEEISVRVSAARGKIPAPHLAGSGVNDKSVIPCACNLVTADRSRRSRTCNTERDENPNSQTKQCTFDVYFCVHKRSDVMTPNDQLGVIYSIISSEGQHTSRPATTIGSE